MGILLIKYYYKENLIFTIDMGVCMLHTFWPEGAVRAFREVIRIESTCAMGYWGLYQGTLRKKR